MEEAAASSSCSAMTFGSLGSTQSEPGWKYEKKTESIKQWIRLQNSCKTLSAPTHIEGGWRGVFLVLLFKQRMTLLLRHNHNKGSRPPSF